MPIFPVARQIGGNPYFQPGSATEGLHFSLHALAFLMVKPKKCVFVAIFKRP